MAYTSSSAKMSSAASGGSYYTSMVRAVSAGFGDDDSSSPAMMVENLQQRPQGTPGSSPHSPTSAHPHAPTGTTTATLRSPLVPAVGHHNSSAASAALPGCSALNQSALSASFSSATSATGGAKRYRHNPYGSEPSTPTMSAAASPAAGPAAVNGIYIGQPQSLHQHHNSSHHSSLNASSDSCGQYHQNSHSSHHGGSHHLPQSQLYSSAAAMGRVDGGNHHHNNTGASAAAASHQTSAAGAGVGAGGLYVDATGMSVLDQFQSAVGALFPAACTPRGRHVLVGVLRLQQHDKLQMIFSELAHVFAALSLDPHGCHVARTLAEHVTPEQATVLCANLMGTDDAMLMNHNHYHHNGNAMIAEVATLSQHTRRILQALFERFPGLPALEPIFAALAADAVALSRTQQGCISIMRAVENGTARQRQQLVDAVLPSLAMLTMDPYGNYVAQAVLESAPDAAALGRLVLGAFTGHWLTLSCNKFGSNVMEKVVRRAAGEARAVIVRELCLGDSLGSSSSTNNTATNNNTSEADAAAAAALQVLVHDGYGNFVVQAIIESAEAGSDEGRRLAAAVRPAIATSPYAHRIEARLRSLGGSGNNNNNTAAAAVAHNNSNNNHHSNSDGNDGGSGAPPTTHRRYHQNHHHNNAGEATTATGYSSNSKHHNHHHNGNNNLSNQHQQHPYNSRHHQRGGSSSNNEYTGGSGNARHHSHSHSHQTATTGGAKHSGSSHTHSSSSCASSTASSSNNSTRHQQQQGSGDVAAHVPRPHRR